MKSIYDGRKITVSYTIDRKNAEMIKELSASRNLNSSSFANQIFTQAIQNIERETRIEALKGIQQEKLNNNDYQIFSNFADWSLQIQGMDLEKDGKRD